MNVGGNQVRDCRVAASEEDIRAGGLEVVVVDPQWPGSVQRVDGLRVARAVDEIGQVGVDDRTVGELELDPAPNVMKARSEEHTSELQSLTNLVCRLLLEKNN